MSIEGINKKLQASFNKYKIRLNPKDYNLRDRIIFDTNLNNQIACYADISIIKDLIDKIKRIKPVHPDAIECSPPFDSLGNYYDRLRELNSNEFTNSALSILLNDNIYVDTGKIIYDVHEDKRHFLGTGLFPSTTDSVVEFYAARVEDYIPSLILGTLPTSLIINLYAIFNRELKFEDIVELDFVKNEIETRGTVRVILPIIIGAPRHINTNSETAFNYIDISGISMESFKHMYIKSVVYAVEIFTNIIQSKLSEDEKQKLLDSLLDLDNGNEYKDTWFNNNFYSYESNEFILPNIDEIFKTTDLEKRYEMLQNLAIHMFKVIDNPEITAHTKGLDYFPPILATLITTLEDYTDRMFLTRLSLRLIEVCKENGIEIVDDNTAPANPTEHTGTGYGDPLNEVEESSEDSENAEVENTLGSIHRGTTYSGTERGSRKSPASVQNIKQSNALLDKALSEFSECSYDFKIKYLKSPISKVTEAMKLGYNKIANAAKLYTKVLIKNIKNIKTYNTGGKMAGLRKGKLDNKRMHMYKQTGEIFYNNKYKIKEMDPAFMILLDESGSMDGDGIENGKIVLIMMHEVLKSLGINHCIAGHTSYGYHNVRIEKYQPFKEDRNYNVDKCYDLLNIDAHSGNCDAGALYYAEKELSRVRNKDKICLIFSDGQPTECTDTELIEQVERMERKGIRVIGIGIGYESIKEYYPHNANGNNLKEMLDIMSDVLREYVLEKAD